MKNLTADQVLKRTFEHLDQILQEKREGKGLREKAGSLQKGRKSKRKSKTDGEHAEYDDSR